MVVFPWLWLKMVSLMVSVTEFCVVLASAGLSVEVNTGAEIVKN
jgi:hypothetical protein